MNPPDGMPFVMPASAVELLAALVRIPSVNPHGVPGVEEPGEKACAEYIAEFLRRCGAEVELREVLPGRPNVIGRFPVDRPGKPRIVLAPHTDTVSVAGMTVAPFGAVIRDGRLHGRGASDTKGPMAAMLWALHNLGESIRVLPCEVWFAGLIGEEAGQHGAHHFVRENRVDFALIGEPTGLDIVYTHKGSAWLALETGGIAAHSSRPELGVNAIQKMLGLLEFVSGELTREFAGIHDPVLGAPSVSIGTISGGTKTNIVPDKCEATVDLRIVPTQANADFTADLRRRLLAHCPDARIDIRLSQPLHTPRENRFIQILEEIGGRCVGAPWFCDAAVFANAGIPAVAAGPGSIAQAHTEDEWIALDEFERGIEFYRAFLCAGSGIPRTVGHGE
jgi:acetylornithine deacetylase/succinyl-diaminopimelate desuccinylase-like protein